MLPGTQGEATDSGPYNRTMLQSLNALLAPALMERLVLVINHVLGAEPAATQRLRRATGLGLPHQRGGRLGELLAFAVGQAVQGRRRWGAEVVRHG